MQLRQLECDADAFVASAIRRPGRAVPYGPELGARAVNCVSNGSPPLCKSLGIVQHPHMTKTCVEDSWADIHAVTAQLCEAVARNSASLKEQTGSMNRKAAQLRERTFALRSSATGRKTDLRAMASTQRDAAN